MNYIGRGLYKSCQSIIEDMEKAYNRLLKRIALNIKRLRKRRKLTQEQMVDHGFSYRFYQKLESGSYSFNLYTLHRLSVAFKVDVQDFFR
jgi:DNA-binding XRE family transcriptional regulator